jgi:hypothetical protein
MIHKSLPTIVDVVNHFSALLYILLYSKLFLHLLPAELAEHTICYVRDAYGEMHAFVDLVPDPVVHEANYDLMRHKIV